MKTIFCQQKLQGFPFSSIINNLTETYSKQSLLWSHLHAHLQLMLLTVLYACTKNGKASNFCSLTQSVGFVCSGLITWCCTILRCYLTVPVEDLISLWDWHIAVMNCYSEPSKKCLQSHRVHANYWNRLLRREERVRERETTMKSSLSGAEIIFELEHGLLIFTFAFSFVPFSLNPPCSKHWCNMIVSIWLVSFLRLIDFLVSLYRIRWQPESPSETLVPKLDFQRKGPGFHPAYLPCGNAVQSLLSSQEQGVRKQQIQSFCHHELFPFPGESVDGHPDPSAQINTAMALNPNSEWNGENCSLHSCEALVPKELSDTTHSSIMGRNTTFCKIDTYRHLGIYIHTDRLS